MKTRKLLYETRYKLKHSPFSIVIPSVGDVLQNEDAYYDLIYVLTAMPVDFMVQLDDAGIDFTSINEFELFILLFQGLKSEDTSLIFDNLNLSDFDIGVNEETGKVALVNKEQDIIIDRLAYSEIASVLRKIHHLEKNRKKPANKDAKEYMLERAKKKLKRNKNRTEDSQLESLIIAMVNTEQFKYDFESVKDISIYQFNESVRQIIKKVDYDNRMFGVYSGTISTKDLSQEDLSWLKH